MSKHYLKYWGGLWQLRFGFCPLCNSSPPYKHCPICWGNRNYGPKLSKVAKQQWKTRWLKQTGC
jgi:hypothetical protein